MNRLVLGHRGFIGSNIRSDYVLDGVDLQCKTSILQAFDRLDTNTNDLIVVNCAGKHGSMAEMAKNHYAYLHTNFLIDSNCLSLCIDRKISNAIMVSSTTCFPENSTGIFSENDLHTGSLSTGVYGYAASKRNTLDLCRCVYSDFGLNVVPIVLGNCYGIRGKFSSSGTIVHKLIYDIDYAMKNRMNVNMSGDGSDIRTFLFASDLERIFFDLIGKNLKGAPVIVASDEQISIKDLANLIADMMGFDKEILFDGRKTIGHRKKIAKSDVIDIRKYQLTPLQDGLQQTIQFYRRINDE